MKKVAFTLGLAFFAIGLFAQTTANTTAKPGNTTSVKATPAQHTKNMSASTTSAKPAQANASKPVAQAPAQQASKPAATQGTAPKKHWTHRNKKAGTAKPKSTPAPKKN